MLHSDVANNRISGPITPIGEYAAGTSNQDSEIRIDFHGNLLTAIAEDAFKFFQATTTGARSPVRIDLSSNLISSIGEDGFSCKIWTTNEGSSVILCVGGARWSAVS